jgi:sucrose phosphorylase
LSDTALISQRFLTAQAIMLALRGVPGIYFHSLVGSQNWTEGVGQTGRYRAINRQKLQLDMLEAELAMPESLRQYIYQGFHHLLDLRKVHPAFHPFGEQKILSLHPALFGLIRTSLDGSENLICLHNISDEEIRITLDFDLFPFRKDDSIFDIISNTLIPNVDEKLKLTLSPYQILWIGKIKKAL